MEDPAPRVSVIVRTRHRPEALAAALRDIRAQTYTDYEIIVVDDTDDPASTVAVAAAWAVNGATTVVPRVGETHGSSSSSRNRTGADAARTGRSRSSPI